MTSGPDAHAWRRRKLALLGLAIGLVAVTIGLVLLTTMSDSSVVAGPPMSSATQSASEEPTVYYSTISGEPDNPPPPDPPETYSERQPVVVVVRESAEGENSAPALITSIAGVAVSAVSTGLLFLDRRSRRRRPRPGSA